MWIDPAGVEILCSLLGPGTESGGFRVGTGHSPGLTFLSLCMSMPVVFNSTLYRQTVRALSRVDVLFDWYDHSNNRQPLQCKPLTFISGVTESSTKQGQHQHKSKMVLSFTVIIGVIAGWVEVIDSRCLCKMFFVCSCVTVGLQ